VSNLIIFTVAGNVVTGLIAFSIDAGYSSTGQTAQVDVSSTTNFVDFTGSKTGSAPEPFPNPRPSASGSVSLLDDYWASLGNTIINNNGRDFLAQCAARPGGTSDRRYSAYGALNYVQAVFHTGYRS
jgi:hypothetical protein